MTGDVHSDTRSISSSLLLRLSELRAGVGVLHPRFGDLMRPDAVRMSRVPFEGDGPYEVDDVIIHLTVTGRCNARCEGCINTALEVGGRPRGQVVTEFECEPSRDADTIVRVALASAHRPVTVALYGGEPLLELDRIEQLIQILDRSAIAARVGYMVYTNGQLLRDALHSHPELWRRVRVVSVSVDGDEAQHRRFRPGTDLATIESGLRQLGSVFRGEVLFWSTLREDQSLRACFEQFLAYHDASLTGHFFWHWAESPEPYHDFSAYARRYGEELEAVVQTYVERLRQGKLLSIVHLNELVLYLLTGRVRGHSACAVELSENYDIVGGRLTACADLPLSMGLLPAPSGELDTACDLGYLVAYRGVLGCRECGVYPYCGGRCPVQVLAGSPERTTQICQLMRLHVGIVQERMGDIASALADMGTTTARLYKESAYLTRYTDVVP